ncbi:hypothetical protein KDW_13010 [Dictyobacter vulcani]|uniref:AB hydrolase-1 domain-containing protein n=1 Tax=Dictyobacter vulcani TaxID=2607529 RepID=A0A5J4KLU3_9CHLR|nr:alpha/beta fold hydrolase [Dictyobacter vulcani]GER87139.1 hypothetical protein KDW_13010 [Dictyobacter vulcani]
MRHTGNYSRASVKILAFALVGVLFMMVRNVLKTPSPLKSVLSGEEHLYTWTHGDIFYKVLGAQDAPPLVLFHAPEVAGSSYEMRNIFDGLAKNYRVYALDLLGFGLSGHPKLAYSAETYISLFQDFLRDVVGQPATLVASGLSCNYCVAVAQRTPDLCSGLVCLSPLQLVQDQLSARDKRNWLGQYKLVTSLYGSIYSRSFLRRALAQQHMVASQQVTDGELQHARAVVKQPGAQHALRAYLDEQLQLDVSQTLQQLSQPVLMIWGGNIPSSSKVQQHSSVVQTTHFNDTSIRVHEERPTAVINQILTWQNKGMRSAQIAETNLAPVTPAIEKVDDARSTPSQKLEVPMSGQPQLRIDETSSDAVIEPAAALPIVEESSSNDPVVEPASVEEILVEQEEAITEPEMEAVVAEALPLVEQEEAVVELTPAPVAEDQQESVVASNFATEEKTEAVLKEPAVQATSDPIASDLIELPIAATEAYCVKCRTKRGMQNGKKIVTKNGRSAMEGTCPVCGTRLFRFVTSK